MIDDITKQIILKLLASGKSQREVSRILSISRNSIKKVIGSNGDNTTPVDVYSSMESSELINVIKTVHKRCQGNVVRVKEVLADEYDKIIPYSTLTDWVRKYDIKKARKRAGSYHFEPGLEMQHDTSPHYILIGEKKIKSQCASLVLAYSRKLYMQYYPCFTRFEAQQFLAEALQFMPGSSRRCVIDNTSVVLQYGSGADAIICPQMEVFGRMYGFEFIAHAIGHADRKGRVERPFYYIETNFLPGRTFKDWQDLNNQAKQWCEKITNSKEKRILNMSPDQAFVQEAPHMIPLPKVIPPVYRHYPRKVDNSGFINLESNRYSVPEKHLGKLLDVYKYPTEVKVFHKNVEVACHARIIDLKNQRSVIKGHHNLIHKVAEKKIACESERQLKGNDDTLDFYIAGLKKKVRGRGARKFDKLLELKRTYPAEAFLHAITRALKYKLYDLHRVEQLIVKYAAGNYFNLFIGDEDEQ